METWRAVQTRPADSPGSLPCQQSWHGERAKHNMNGCLDLERDFVMMMRVRVKEVDKRWWLNDDGEEGRETRKLIVAGCCSHWSFLLLENILHVISQACISPIAHLISFWKQFDWFDFILTHITILPNMISFIVRGQLGWKYLYLADKGLLRS